MGWVAEVDIEIVDTHGGASEEAGGAIGVGRTGKLNEDEAAGACRACPGVATSLHALALPKDATRRPLLGASRLASSAKADTRATTVRIIGTPTVGTACGRSARHQNNTA